MGATNVEPAPLSVVAWPATVGSPFVYPGFAVVPVQTGVGVALGADDAGVLEDPQAARNDVPTSSVSAP